MRIHILQWNIQKKPELLPILLAQRPRYDVLAIMEPPFDTTGVQCPSWAGYRLIQCPPPQRARCVLYVREGLRLKEWEAHPDWCMAEIGPEGAEITVWAVYSPSPPATQGGHWETPLSHLAARPARDNNVLVGDFNLHHPRWMPGRRPQIAADKLLHLCDGWGLELLTQPGVATRQAPGTRDSTLDLAWASSDISAETRTGMLRGSDHLPQITTINMDAEPPRGPPRFNWRKMDTQRIMALSLSLPTPGQLQSTGDVDTYLGQLTQRMEEIRDITVPKTKGRNKGAAWWTMEIDELIRQERLAHRKWHDTWLDGDWEKLREATQAKKRLVRSEKRKTWRRTIHEVALKNHASGLWKISKWARNTSHKPVEAPSLPQLRIAGGTASTFGEKVQALRSKFFPTTTADISDLTLPLRPSNNAAELSQIPRVVEEKEIRATLSRTGSWKAPGLDGFPNGFLKALGRPLSYSLAETFTVCLQLGYFPRRYREARTIVLRKPDRDPSQLNAWRPIALLNTIGKLFEAVMARRIAEAAEECQLLPDEQMGNRKDRSCEVALQMLVDQVHTAWDMKGIVSMLSLDISGAFDTVCHCRLIRVLQENGFPAWLTGWVASFLEDRTTSLLFDNEESEMIPVPSGVPQGSPLSPILFILYTSELYEKLRPCRGVNVLAYADDTTLLSFAQDATQGCSQLATAHEICLDWARRYGARFDPSKYKLIYLTRRHHAPTLPLTLGEMVVKPEEKVRLLGLWFDRKLRWTHHLRELREKLTKQTLSLSRIAASTWGPPLARARHVYLSTIRAAIGFASTAYHEFNEKRERPRGVIARDMAKAQNRCLRIITGAYKATPIRLLETEAYVPPIDIWMDVRAATFGRRLRDSGMEGKIQQQCQEVRHALRNRRTRTAPPQECRTARKRRLATEWLGDSDKDSLELATWTDRFNRHGGRSHLHRHRHIPAEHPPNSETLLLHRHIYKAESSLLVQMRTERIGFRDFLTTAFVPTVDSPHCTCGGGRETARHVLFYCARETERRLRHESIHGLMTPSHLSDPIKAGGLAKWLMRTGRLEQYRLAVQLIQEYEVDDEADREDS